MSVCQQDTKVIHLPQTLYGCLARDYCLVNYCSGHLLTGLVLYTDLLRYNKRDPKILQECVNVIAGGMKNKLKSNNEWFSFNFIFLFVCFGLFTLSLH